MTTLAVLIIEGMRVALMEDGSWQVASTNLRESLSARFPAAMFETSPTDSLGRKNQAVAAARHYGVSVRFMRQRPGVQDRVY